MNVYDLIYVQLQLSLFRNEPVTQYLERELFCGQTLCRTQKKANLNMYIWNQNITLKTTDKPHCWAAYYHILAKIWNNMGANKFWKIS